MAGIVLAPGRYVLSPLSLSSHCHHRKDTVERATGIGSKRNSESACVCVW